MRNWYGKVTTFIRKADVCKCYKKNCSSAFRLGQIYFYIIILLKYKLCHSSNSVIHTPFLSLFASNLDYFLQKMSL